MIVKADGEKEPFDPTKLQTSLARAGAPHGVVKKIVSEIEGTLEDGMTTSEIYRHAFKLLKKERRGAAGRYSVRRAVAELGPSGFPFEKFIARILDRKGYKTETNQMAQGHCLEHEVDVVAYNDEELIMIEAKFHGSPSMKTDSKDILYVKSRFDDLKLVDFNYGGKKRKLTKGWLVTNTKFTTSAIKFAECHGMQLIGWDYPPLKGNLESLIQEVSVNPITCLPSLSKKQKDILMEKGIVLAESLKDNKEELLSLGLSEKKANDIIEESLQVIHIN